MEELTISSVEEFFGLLPKFRERASMYRGVPDQSYGLVPRIGRPSSRYDGKYHPTIERAVLQRFQAMAVPYLGATPTDELDWLVLAQHHGLPTRLLDWTTNPLVGLYFAVEGNAHRGCKLTEHAALYVAPQPGEVLYSAPRALEIGNITLVRPRHLSSRITAQSALFTIHPKPDEEYCPEGALKIIVKRSACGPLEYTVGEFGFHRAALFPSLDGLCDELARAYWSSDTVGKLGVRQPRS